MPETLIPKTSAEVVTSTYLHISKKGKGCIPKGLAFGDVKLLAYHRQRSNYHPNVACMLNDIKIGSQHNTFPLVCFPNEHENPIQLEFKQSSVLISEMTPASKCIVSFLFDS